MKLEVWMVPPKGVYGELSYLLGMAKAEALLIMGDRRATDELLERYV